MLHNWRVFPGNELEMELLIGTHRWVFGAVTWDTFSGSDSI